MSKRIMLRISTFVFAAAVVAWRHPRVAQEGPLYVNRDARFAVIFPGEPMVSARSLTRRVQATPFRRGSFSSSRVRTATR